MTSAELRAAFARPPAFVPTTAHYRLRLMLVLAGMFLLYLAYVLLVALIAAIGWFGTRALWGAAPPNLLTATLLVGFPAASAIAVVFLLKPVLTRPPRPPKPLEILPESEPLLFEFVQRICTLLDAPEPSRILVDLQVNASASIPGSLGLLWGRYDLTVGLPLAGCLALPEFAGVVAHEIGHFSQLAGLRSYFLIESIQRWFQRVVEERDRFDAWLDRLCTRRDIRLKAVAHFARMMVAASRKYLFFLMRIGRRISSDFSRHMEFDADRREAAVVGVEAFANTFRRLDELNAATIVAWLWVTESRNSGLFPDDYVELVRAGENAIADGVVSVRKKLREKSRFDTHPSNQERIAAVRAFKPLVRLELEGKAERLFHNLGAICRQATMDAYDRIFGQASGGRNMIPARDAIARMEERRAGKAAAFAMFNLG
jgi:Zn-dependent protease with chaperone function